VSCSHNYDADDSIEGYDADDADDSIEGCGWCGWCDAFVEADQWWGDLCKKCGKKAQEALKNGRKPFGGGVLIP